VIVLFFIVVFSREVNRHKLSPVIRALEETFHHEVIKERERSEVEHYSFCTMLSSYFYAVLILLLHSRILSAFLKIGRISSNSIHISRYAASNHIKIQQSLLVGVSLEMKKNVINVYSEVPYKKTTTTVSNVSRRPKSYDLIKNCLLNYKKLYGDMLVPYNFIVSNNSSDWPKEAWRMKLGKILCTYG
jgi:hypothetical protein